MTQLDQFGRVALFVTGKDVTVQDIDDVLKKSSNQLKATPGLNNDTNIFWLVPALGASSLRVPKNANGGTSAPVNPSFHSPWIEKSVQEVAVVLKADLPRLGAFVRPTFCIVADHRTASDGSLLWCRILGGPGQEIIVDYIRASARAAALHLARRTVWEEVKQRWQMTRATDGDVLDDVAAPK